ncbi:MAG: cupin domain-containing protein [Aigarchaeota archaeon]|nr:cupin domain-containing protein [Aigarchaeota archaeon]
MWRTINSQEILFTPYKKGKANIKRIFTDEAGCKRFTGFGLLEIPPGGIFPTHTHPEREEIYYVIDGAGHVLIEDIKIEAKKGLSLYVSGDIPHGIENQTDKPLLVLFVHSMV